MKFKNILLSSSLAIAAVFAGFTFADSSAQADTIDSANVNIQSAQVTPSDTQADQTAATNTDQTQATAKSAQKQAATSDQTEQVQATQAQNQATQATATTNTADSDAAATDSTTSDSKTDATKDKILSTVKDTAKNAAADIVGKDVVAPVSEGLLAKVKPLSNVYAGATGFVDPSSNPVGKASHDIQNAAIDVVGNLPGGTIPSVLMKLAQPLDLIDNGLGGLYGLATGENDLIPNAIGDKVTEAIKGTDSTTKTTAKTDYSDGYQNTRINGTVTTVTQAPLFNVMEQPVSRSLANGTSWVTDIKRQNTKSGAQYYRVSTNEYVRAQDVQFN